MSDSSPRCRTCDQPILWVVFPSGKKCPLDPLPAKGGKVKLDGPQQADGTQEAHVIGGDERARLVPGTQLYTVHFDTCPQARQHRRR